MERSAPTALQGRHAVCAELSIRGEQGGCGSPGTRLLAHARSADGHYQLLEQLRPRQFPEKLIPLMILNALEGRALPIYGDGGNVRDWLHVDDHCAGILAVLECGRIGEKYNIGGSAERTNFAGGRDTVFSARSPSCRQRAIRWWRRRVVTWLCVSTFPDHPGHDRRYAIDATKIQHELGWKPAHDFASGIHATVAWYVENREWCRAVQSGATIVSVLASVRPGNTSA